MLNDIKLNYRNLDDSLTLTNQDWTTDANRNHNHTNTDQANQLNNDQPWYQA